MRNSRKVSNGSPRTNHSISTGCPHFVQQKAPREVSGKFGERECHEGDSVLRGGIEFDPILRGQRGSNIGNRSRHVNLLISDTSRMKKLTLPQ